jgi:hypothetical protein
MIWLWLGLNFEIESIVNWMMTWIYWRVGLQFFFDGFVDWIKGVAFLFRIVRSFSTLAFIGRRGSFYGKLQCIWDKTAITWRFKFQAPVKKNHPHPSWYNQQSHKPKIHRKKKYDRVFQKSEEKKAVVSKHNV